MPLIDTSHLYLPFIFVFAIDRYQVKDTRVELSYCVNVSIFFSNKIALYYCDRMNFGYFGSQNKIALYCRDRVNLGFLSVKIIR
jgi:hypothetical protein